MSRKVFYSFHYERDSQRAAQVRNSHALADEDEYGVIDAVDWEKVERAGREAIVKWINEQLKFTSVTAVLIGAETADREWVDYEIRRSWERGNGLVGVRIHNVKNLDGEIDVAGLNPFDNIELADGTRISSIIKVYDWVSDSGIRNLGAWVEDAYQTRSNYRGETALKDSKSLNSTGSQPVRNSYQPINIINPPRPWSV